MIIKAYRHIILTMFQKYESFIDLDLEVIWRIKYFSFKSIVVAYVKIKYTNKNTSNNGDIDLNMCKKSSFYGYFWRM